MRSLKLENKMLNFFLYNELKLQVNFSIIFPFIYYHQYINQSKFISNIIINFLTYQIVFLIATMNFFKACQFLEHIFEHVVALV